MKILVLNGNPDPERSTFDGYLDRLSAQLREGRHAVEVLRLRDLEIQHCVGCWSCWVQTPGLCQFEDDSHDVCRRYINSDLVLFASPMVMGFVTALLKSFNEKLLPLLHPYIELVQGECHHRRRYQSYPLLGLLLEQGEQDDDDVTIVSDIYRRNALNMKSRLCFTRTMDRGTIPEVVDAINGIQRVPQGGPQ